MAGSVSEVYPETRRRQSGTAGGLNPGAHYPLSKEYALNEIGIHDVVSGIYPLTKGYWALWEGSPETFLARPPKHCPAEARCWKSSELPGRKEDLVKNECHASHGQNSLLSIEAL